MSGLRSRRTPPAGAGRRGTNGAPWKHGPQAHGGRPALPSSSRCTTPSSPSAATTPSPSTAASSRPRRPRRRLGGRRRPSPAAPSGGRLGDRVTSGRQSGERWRFDDRQPHHGPTTPRRTSDAASPTASAATTCWPMVIRRKRRASTPGRAEPVRRRAEARQPRRWARRGVSCASPGGRWRTSTRRSRTCSLRSSSATALGPGNGRASGTASAGGPGGVGTHWVATHPLPGRTGTPVGREVVTDTDVHEPRSSEHLGGG